MISCTSKLIVRTLNVALVLACAFSGCTCSDHPATPPQLSTAVETRPLVAPPTATRRATGVLGTKRPTVAPTAVPTAVPPTPDSAKQAACGRMVANLLSRSPDRASVDSHLATAELLTCAAVLNDSDELCRQYFQDESGPVKMCRHMRAIFHELRTYPQGKAFLFDDVDYQECRTSPSVPAKFCDAMRAALRSGTVDQCAQTGDGDSICRAYMTLDKSLCSLQGKMATIEIELPDRKEGAPDKVKLKVGLDDFCVRAIESRAFLAQGLQELAQSGPPREREFAKAALGEKDACLSLAAALMESCMQAGPTKDAPAPPGAPPAANPTPVAPSGAAPAEQHEPS